MLGKIVLGRYLQLVGMRERPFLGGGGERSIASTSSSFRPATNITTVTEAAYASRIAQAMQVSSTLATIAERPM